MNNLGILINYNIIKSKDQLINYFGKINVINNYVWIIDHIIKEFYLFNYLNNIIILIRHNILIQVSMLIHYLNMII